MAARLALQPELRTEPGRAEESQLLLRREQVQPMEASRCKILPGAARGDPEAKEHGLDAEHVLKKPPAAAPSPLSPLPVGQEPQQVVSWQQAQKKPSVG